jgi:hypothetical protein
MAWVSIRSRRAPAFWAPLVLAPLLAMLLALLAQHQVDAHVRSLEALAESDPQAAARAAEGALRALAWLAGGFSVFAAGLLGRYFQLGLRQRRLPPAGWWWSLGAHRAATGPTAQRLARLGLALAALLALLGLAAGFYLEYLIGALALDG